MRGWTQTQRVETDSTQFIFADFSPLAINMECKFLKWTREGIDPSVLPFRYLQLPVASFKLLPFHFHAIPFCSTLQCAGTPANQSHRWQHDKDSRHLTFAQTSLRYCDRESNPRVSLVVDRNFTPELLPNQHYTMLCPIHYSSNKGDLNQSRTGIVNQYLNESS